MKNFPHIVKKNRITYRFLSKKVIHFLHLVKKFENFLQFVEKK